MTVAVAIFLIVAAGVALGYGAYRAAGAIRRVMRDRSRRQARLEFGRSLINRSRS